MMKLDKYFSTSRKYILNKYNMRSSKPVDVNPVTYLEKLTKNPTNYFRALESEKDKREFMQLMHRNIGFGNGKIGT